MSLHYTEADFTVGERNLDFLKKSLPQEDLYFWFYLPDGRLIASNCPQEEAFGRVFELVNGPELARQHAAAHSDGRPFLIGSDFGLRWAVTFEKARGNNLMAVVGPVFYSPVTDGQLRAGLSPYLTGPETVRWAAEFRRLREAIPVLNPGLFLHHAILVHNTLNGERLRAEDLLEIRPEGAHAAGAAAAHDRNHIYLAEQALLKAVRDGDINYQSTLNRSMLLSSGTPTTGRDPLRNVKTSITVFVTLVSRAAMEGGLSPEIAYPLGDSYIQSAEDCRDMGELSSLAVTMYHDFIYRVHHLRANPDYSYTVQKCCDYIALSLDKKVRAADLAALTGYAEYYLTDKFRKETGLSISAYIRREKLERAKTLLASTELSIQEISERLAFSTPNYFARCFKEDYGETPLQFRKKKQRRNP